jgi:hypothetical protein
VALPFKLGLDCVPLVDKLLQRWRAVVLVVFVLALGVVGFRLDGLGLGNQTKCPIDAAQIRPRFAFGFGRFDGPPLLGDARVFLSLAFPELNVGLYPRQPLAVGDGVLGLEQESATLSGVLHGRVAELKDLLCIANRSPTRGVDLGDQVSAGDIGELAHNESSRPAILARS